jgi:hypothetical protein
MRIVAIVLCLFAAVCIGAIDLAVGYALLHILPTYLFNIAALVIFLCSLTAMGMLIYAFWIDML